MAELTQVFVRTLWRLIGLRYDSRRRAIRTLFDRMKYPNWGLGGLLRNAPTETGVGGIRREPTVWWR